MRHTPHYKVSYVVEDGEHPGALLDTKTAPHVGQEVSFDGATFVIVELEELMPAEGDFGLFHATCRTVRSGGN